MKTININSFFQSVLSKGFYFLKTPMAIAIFTILNSIYFLKIVAIEIILTGKQHTRRYINTSPHKVYYNY